MVDSFDDWLSESGVEVGELGEIGAIAIFNEQSDIQENREEKGFINTVEVLERCTGRVASGVAWKIRFVPLIYLHIFM